MSTALFEVEFYNNKKALRNRRFFLIALVLCIAVLVYAIVEVINNYKSIGSLLKLIQPIVTIVLLYMQYKSYSIFNKYFKMTDATIGYNIDESNSVINIEWQNVASIKISNNTLNFYTKNNQLYTLPLSYFSYSQIQSLKKIILVECK